MTDLDDALMEPLEPLPHPVGFTPPPRPPMDPDTSFNLTRYAAERGILVATLRSKLRHAGFKTPYRLADVEALLAE